MSRITGSQLTKEAGKWCVFFDSQPHSITKWRIEDRPGADWQ